MSSKKIEMFDKYPFNQLVVSDVSNLLILQRIKLEERLDIQKILMLRGLKHHYLIKLKSVKNEEGCIVLAYEYVPTSLEIWVNDKNDEQIAQFQKRIFQLARYLANERVSIKFRKECIGVDAEGEPKYFLGMDFDKYPNADLLELEIKYKDEIRLLMLHQKKQSSPALAKKQKALARQRPSSKTLQPNLQQFAKDNGVLVENGHNGSNQAQNLTKDRLKLISQAIERSKAQLQKAEFISKGKDQGFLSPRVQNGKIQNQNIFKAVQKNQVSFIPGFQPNKDSLFKTGNSRSQQTLSIFHLENGLSSMVTRSRVDAMAMKEYKYLKNSNDLYIKQFIQVLEEDQAPPPENHIVIPPLPLYLLPQGQVSKQKVQTARPSYSTSANDGKQLMEKVTSAINQSLVILERLKRKRKK